MGRGMCGPLTNLTPFKELLESWGPTCYCPSHPFLLPNSVLLLLDPRARQPANVLHGFCTGSALVYCACVVMTPALPFLPFLYTSNPTLRIPTTQPHPTT